MITLNAVQARIRRQKIELLAGNSYVPASNVASKIPYLHKASRKQFLFGIFDSEQRWTALSVSHLYAAYDTRYSTLQLDAETQTIFRYFSEESDFCESVFLRDGRCIWMGSAELSSQILNLMLMLEKIPCGTVLEP